MRRRLRLVHSDHEDTVAPAPDGRRSRRRLVAGWPAAWSMRRRTSGRSGGTSRLATITSSLSARRLTPRSSRAPFRRPADAVGQRGTRAPRIQPVRLRSAWERRYGDLLIPSRLTVGGWFEPDGRVSSRRRSSPRSQPEMWRRQHEPSHRLSRRYRAVVRARRASSATQLEGPSAAHSNAARG